MAYGPQSVSLTREAGGDLDLLDALRGRGFRIKTQQEMLREQSMSPVEIGSYNGIQGNFPISAGFNKIAQGLLATYMDSQARDRAQAAADAQKEEAQNFATQFAGTPAVQGSRPNTPEEIAAYESDTAAREKGFEPYLGRAAVGDELPTPPIPPAGPLGLGGQPARPDPTPAQRTALLMQGYASPNPIVNRMATFIGNQDEKERDRQDKLDSRAEIARQHNETMRYNAALLAQSRGATTDAKTQQTNDAAYTKQQPIFAKADAGFNTALASLDTTTGLIADISKHPKLGDVVAPRNSLIHWAPTMTAEAEELQKKIKQLMATGSLNVLQQLKSSGASLGVVSNADAERLDKAFSSLSLTTDPVIFKKELARIQTEVNNMRARIAEQQVHAQNYAQSLYERTQNPNAKLYNIPPSTREASPEPTPRPPPAPGDDPKPPVASAPLPPDAIAKLGEGQLTTFGNGQVWTLKDGQPKQVK